MAKYIEKYNQRNLHVLSLALPVFVISWKYWHLLPSWLFRVPSLYKAYQAQWFYYAFSDSRHNHVNGVMKTVLDSGGLGYTLSFAIKQI